MERAKRFFYVCAGILALVISAHVGAKSVESQAANVVAAAVPHYVGTLIIAENGDMYLYGSNPSGYPCEFAGNIFTCLRPTSTEGTSWGRIKAERR